MEFYAELGLTTKDGMPDPVAMQKLVLKCLQATRELKASPDGRIREVVMNAEALRREEVFMGTLRSLGNNLGLLCTRRYAQPQRRQRTEGRGSSVLSC
jgi:hypothetical protein